MPMKGQQFSNPMHGVGDGLETEMLPSGTEGSAADAHVVASKPVREALEKVSEAKTEALAQASSAKSHIVRESKTIIEQQQTHGVDPKVEDPFVPHADRDMTDHKSKAKFKAFVRETMLERVVFGTRDPTAEHAMVEAIWTGEAFDSDKKISHPSGLWNGLLYPESKIRLWYDAVQMAAVCVTSVLVPWRLAFDETPAPGSTEFAVDVMIDSLFFFDIYLNFFNYLRNEATGQLITDRHVIRRKYLFGFFALDCIASNPLDYILLLSGDKASSEEARNMRLLRIMRISRTLRLTRLLRLLRTSRLQALTDHIHNKLISWPAARISYKMIGLWLLIFAVGHIIGCFWLHQGIVHAGSPPHGSWIDHRNWYKHESACEPIDSLDNPELDVIAPTPSFHVYHECIDTDRITKGHMYMESLYFSIVTMTSVGYGDITPRSSNEKFWCTLMMVLGGFVWAIVIAVFSETLAGISEHERLYENKLRRVATMLKFLGASKDLKKKIMRFYQFRFRKRRFFEDRMFNELPPRLRREFVALRFSEALYKVPFFRNCNDATLIKICTHMQSFSVFEGEVIIEEGDSDRDLFVLEKGRAEAYVGNKMEPVEFLPEGSFFGEMSFFGLATSRAATVVAATYSELSWLCYEDFSEVLDGDVALRKRMHDFAALRQAVYKLGLSDDLNTISDDITCVDEAEKTELGSAVRQKVQEAYEKIQSVSLDPNAVADNVDGEDRHAFVVSEQEQLRMRVQQVELSVIRMHELMGAMAEKVGVDKEVIQAQGPKLVDFRPPVVV